MLRANFGTKGIFRKTNTLEWISYDFTPSKQTANTFQLFFPCQLFWIISIKSRFYPSKTLGFSDGKNQRNNNIWNVRALWAREFLAVQLENRLLEHELMTEQFEQWKLLSLSNLDFHHPSPFFTHLKSRAGTSECPKGVSQLRTI